MNIPAPIPGLDSASLMAHMRFLCKQIGSRPPASPQEYAAGEYVKAVLADLALPAPGEQKFLSQNSFGWVVIPPTLLAVLAIPLGVFGRWGKLSAALLMLIGLIGIYFMLTAAPPFYHKLIERWPSRNLWVDLPPTGEVKRRLYLVGHLDTQKVRYFAPIPWPQFQDVQMASTLLMTAAVVIWLLAGGILGWVGLPWYIWTFEGLLILSLLIFLNDERQPHIEGANDNATAVSVLLGMARALRDQPLQHTAVTLLFTGCEEVPCVGMEAYLNAHPIPQAGVYWLDLEMVGTGNLCYVTRHGMSSVAAYYPHPELLRLAAQVAAKHPTLKVTGKPMSIMEEVANLRRRGYQAICLAGYNAQGFLPNWHRLSDCLENIEPPILERAANFAWALAQELDCIDEVKTS